MPDATACITQAALRVTCLEHSCLPIPAEDVLSALDSHVASHICSKLLRGPLLAITLAREAHSLQSLAEMCISSAAGRQDSDTRYVQDSVE